MLMQMTSGQAEVYGEVWLKRAESSLGLGFRDQGAGCEVRV